MTQLYCDLTAETPAVYDVHYRAQVFADGSNHGQTKDFKPVAATVLGAPILLVHTTSTSLHINVTLPLGPNNESITDIFKRNKGGPSEAVTFFTLKITQPTWAAQETENTTGHFIISLKNDQTEYCGHVVYKPAFEWGRNLSEKASFCVTLPADPWMMVPWSLMSVAVLAAVVLLLVCCVCHYVKGGKKESMPESLKPFSYHSSNILQSKDEDLLISKVDISTKASNRTVYAELQARPNVSSVSEGHYAHKNTILHPWHSDWSVNTVEVRSPGLNHQGSSSQSTEIYSAVAVQVPRENKDFDPLQTDRAGMGCHGEGLGKSGSKVTSLGAQPLSNLYSNDSNEAKPLLLQTVRDSNGQLILPILSQQNTLSEITDPLSTPERKPLLSDLIVSKHKGPSFVSLHSLDSSDWSDSGCDDSTVNTPTHAYCNSQYSPTEQVRPHFNQWCQRTQSADSGTYDSPYKQNWMPTNIPGSSTDTSWPWSGLKEGNEEEKDEVQGQGELGQIFLKSWMVQIQE